MSTSPPDPSLDRLFTIPDAADRLALKRGSVYQLVARGEIKIARPTKWAIRIPESELRRLMAARAEFRRGAACESGPSPDPTGAGVAGRDSPARPSGRGARGRGRATPTGVAGDDSTA
jgi:excisionase family DNA binding protein